MIVEADLKVYHTEATFTSGIHISLKFKEKGRFFKTRLFEVVVRDNDRTFAPRVVEYLKNEDNIKRDGENMIKKYFENKAVKLKLSGHQEEAERLLKEIKNKIIKIKIEI